MRDPLFLLIWAAVHKADTKEMAGRYVPEELFAHNQDAYFGPEPHKLDAQARACKSGQQILIAHQ